MHRNASMSSYFFEGIYVAHFFSFFFLPSIRFIQEINDTIWLYIFHTLTVNYTFREYIIYCGNIRQVLASYDIFLQQTIYLGNVRYIMAINEVFWQKTIYFGTTIYILTNNIRFGKSSLYFEIRDIFWQYTIHFGNTRYILAIHDTFWR